MENKENEFSSIKIGLASPEQIREWSYGEVTKPETINYRTLKPERDGLFCERIFGPMKDWECHCGKYKRVRYKGKVCERCGVEITRAKVRRERMGHIELAAPVSHIWYFKGIPSRLGLVLDLSPRYLEKVLYFALYIVTDPGDTPLEKMQILNEKEYAEMRERYEDDFEAGMGAEAIKKLLQDIDVKALRDELTEELETATGQKRVRLHARAVLEEMGLENEVTLIGARVHGSRSRDDLYRADSDLDVVLSYRGNIREDSFFNELNSYGMAIAGIKVDITPILEERITLAEYIKESEAYLDQQEIRKLAVDLDNFSYEYDTYEYKDTVENREEQVEKLTEDILNKETAGLKDWLTEVAEESDIDSDVVTAQSLLSRLKNAETLSVFTRQPEQKQPEDTITFYVAECMEFPVMGEYHENLTLEEALRIYESIPAERINGIKGVGFELHDGSDYDGPYDLMRLGKVDREGVEMIPHYKESPLVQKAMDDVEKYFDSKQEITKIEEKAVEDKSVPKENLPQPKSRKESVLQALRERQAKIKEQEQNMSKEKSKAHKKGDVTL